MTKHLLSTKFFSFLSLISKRVTKHQILPKTSDYQHASESCRNILILSTNSDFLIILSTVLFNIVRTSPLSLAKSIAVKLAVFQASISALNMIISTFLDFFNLKIQCQKLEIHLHFPHSENVTLFFSIKNLRNFLSQIHHN